MKHYLIDLKLYIYIYVYEIFKMKFIDLRKWTFLYVIRIEIIINLKFVILWAYHKTNNLK